MNWNFDSPILIQGIAEPLALKDLNEIELLETNIVVGVNASQQDISIAEIEIFDLVEEAIKAVGEIKTSLICVPAYQVLDASLEAIASGIEQLIILTKNVPPLDTIELFKVAESHNIKILGSGSYGLIFPEKLCLGTFKPEYFQSGNIGMIGYSKSLIYEVAWALNRAEIGQSLVISLGQDKIIGSNLIQWLEILDRDETTEVIVLIQSAQDIDSHGLEFLSVSTTKPVICYVAGSQTPAEQVFREGLAIVKNHLSNSIPATNSYRKIITKIQKSDVTFASKPAEIPLLVSKFIKDKNEKNNE